LIQSFSKTTGLRERKDRQMHGLDEIKTNLPSVATIIVRIVKVSSSAG
jgi:hypothetical protein